ncbi:hypothetical protein SAMN04487930_10917 [Cytophaga hutchinsonii ATCC 33406]|nr:hypothetical protein SAMN04487930_10917 [Cytophaga hutchinsonii ATCC 33406]
MVLFSEFTNVDDLKANKNLYFSTVLKANNSYYNKQNETLPYKSIYSEDDLIVFRLAAKKGRIIQDSNFTQKQVEDYPDVLVIINNNPEIQKIAISRNIQAFSSSDVVLHILESKYRDLLRAYNLQIYIKPIFKTFEFWQIANQYEGRVEGLEFELIKPNMSNISGSLRESFKSIIDTTNSHTTKLVMKAPEDSSLEHIDSNNEDLKGMVDYASEGGGEISIKVKGIKRKIKTKKSSTQVSIDSIELTGNPNAVITAYNKIIGS